MWSPATRNATLALACATLVTLAAVEVTNRVVQWRVTQHWRQVAAERRKQKANVPRATLREFQTDPQTHQWVALCGTVFSVVGDSFFDARAGGIYATWLRHDVAALLVYGGVIDGRPENETEAALLDREIELNDVDNANGDVAKRRRLIVDEWYARFHARYHVVGQLSDLYVSDAWETLRDEVTPPPPTESNDGEPRRRGKCPLGFGASTVEHEEVQIRDEDASTVRAICFQGRRYDVRGSALFDSAFAHFVGHDITFALATQSTDPRDLDVVATREYSYNEQLRLEHYRRVFAKELRVISSSNETQNETVQANTAVVDLHQLIDQDADVDEIRRALDDAVASAAAEEALRAVCLRTTMTPLHKAVEKNRFELVQLLINAGADVHAPAALYDDETALQMAQRFHHSEIVRVLAAHIDI